MCVKAKPQTRHTLAQKKINSAKRPLDLIWFDNFTQDSKFEPLAKRWQNKSIANDVRQSKATLQAQWPQMDDIC